MPHQPRPAAALATTAPGTAGPGDYLDSFSATMPAPPFLLATWPTVHPVLLSLLGAVLTAAATWFWTSRSERRAAKVKAAEAEQKRLTDVAEAARQAEADKHEWEDYCRRLSAAEDRIKGFMPESNIREELTKLGRDVAENEKKIKTQHDRTEDAINALNGRTNTLEQHNATLTLLPGEVITLKADHRVLASEVRALAGSVERLSDKQDSHFSKLMEAVQSMAYTRGELHGGQRRPLPPNTYELPQP